MICRYQRQILDQLETILDRDLRQIHDTTLTLPELLRLLRELALRDGRTFNYLELRAELVKAGKLLEIDVHDHLVISGGRFTSMRERGLGFD